jgi:DNA polymerase-3 subunit delta
VTEEKKPVIYLFYGDDDLAISEAIKNLKARLGDQSTADLNISTLDGRSFSSEEFETASKSTPFLAERRLIVVNNPLAFMNSDSNRTKFLTLLEAVPDHNAVVLVENAPLSSDRQKRRGEEHWFEEWGRAHGERVFMREFVLLQGAQMTTWIMERARKSGGQFNPGAAQQLASMVGDDPRLADQEIIKLLTYVNTDRPVEITDVVSLTPALQEGDIFELVDALGNRDESTAIVVFHRLLADQDPLRIFSMIVRQFRFLLLAREILDHNGGEAEVVRQLSPKPFRLHPFVAKKVVSQARQFSLTQLETIHHLLLEIDTDMKSGQMEIGLSVDLMIAEITSPGSH